MSKFFRLRQRALAFLALLLLPLLCMQLGQAEAARRSAVHELNYFRSMETEVDGEQVLRLEIGLNRDNLDYTVIEKQRLRRQLVLDLQETKPGRVKKNIKLNNEFVSAVKVQEPERRHTQILIDLTDKYIEGTYKVYTVEADRKERKPYRLVVDIYKKPVGAAGSVDGVKGHSIVIDPGHGGSDSGTVGPSGLTEKAVTLAVSQQLRDILEASGGHVKMTRDTDKDVYGWDATASQELQARVNVGERMPGAEIFISVHINAFSNPNAHGMETYYYGGSSGGKRLASLINQELQEAGGLFNRGVKTANFYVIKHSSMPATLLELAFITNPREERLLADADYQQKLAQAIARGVARYFGRG